MKKSKTQVPRGAIKTSFTSAERRAAPDAGGCRSVYLYAWRICSHTSGVRTAEVGMELGSPTPWRELNMGPGAGVQPAPADGDIDPQLPAPCRHRGAARGAA